ncbi:MAG: SusD/RagB family nutrient-binding outer membrane lipoprotein [Tannerellaceae bacterium]|nr:SusD/RagB family nutrient-binding outer membrane lipoprotein [Tannerellaceae bacterium]
MKHKILAAVAACMILFTGCKDDFAEINTDPSSVSEGNINYLFTQGLLDFEPSGYTFWFYNAQFMTQWAQAFVPTEGFSSNFNTISALGDQGEKTYNVMRTYREVAYILSEMDEEEAAMYTQTVSMFYPLMVYLGLFDTDMFGDMPYTEACMARYTDPMLLTPGYDTLEDLYDLWIDELNTAINAFLNTTTTQISIGNQDFVYGGDMAKWAKFANSLKLKIAVRLLHANFSRAISLAEEAASNAAGFMESASDDFLYNRATDSGDNAFHFGNSVYLGAGNKDVVDFLKKNWDPRIRFFYNKNDYNSRVIQGFLDTGTEIPSFIAENIEVDANNNFVGWSGMGEPWDRYYGLPSDYNAKQIGGEFREYFDNALWKLSVNGAEKEYTPYSAVMEELIRGRVGYTYPDLPNAAVTIDDENVPWWGLFMSSAEVNLYLAELKLLGANLPKSAEEYYTLGIQQSVEAYDNLANLNKIPYYHFIYDEHDVSIALTNGEIDKMLEQEDYIFTGSADDLLEKVYIQQYLHFTFQPTDMYMAVRRSGIPKKDSKLIAWKDIVANTEIPRRFDVSTPSVTDQMYNIILAAMQRQGLSTGQANNPSALNSERLWMDKGAPNFGEGPNF